MLFSDHMFKRFASPKLLKTVSQTLKTKKKVPWDDISGFSFLKTMFLICFLMLISDCLGDFCMSL